MAPVKPRELYSQDDEQKKFWQGVRANPRRTARDVRSRFRDIDRRLADVETYVTSSNHRLSQEIESLRYEQEQGKSDVLGKPGFSNRRHRQVLCGLADPKRQPPQQRITNQK